MTRRTSLFLAVIPLLLAGLSVVASPASARLYGGYYDWKTVSAGGNQTCLTRSTGKLYCWGTDGTGSSLYPLSGASDWTSVTAGAAHQCAIRSSGILYCWGDDSSGQVGNGAGGSPTVTTQITTATNWTSASAGDSHTCAVRGTGILYCWGNDANGQLGNGSASSATAPQQITAATNWRSVSAGATHTCAIRTYGILYCWGNDANGQLGNSSTGSMTVPQQITSATDWKSVSAGASHTCAIRSTGKLYCWGNDANGQVGNSSGGSPTTPIQITSATDWKSVSAGGAHTCAMRGSGVIYCWGADNYNQSVEGGGTEDVVYPQRVGGSYADWRSIDAGRRHTCALRGGGALYCWGAQSLPSNGTPAGSAYPASLPNLGHLHRWKLTIPYDGSDAGTVADEIKWPQLGSYRSTSFFHTTSDNKAVVFRTPVGGAKTGGSVFARSEMRERTRWDGSDQANCNWSNQSGVHVMEIDQRVTHLPPRIPRVVVGQIHDPRDEVVMIRVDGSTIIAEASYPDPAYEDGRKVQVVLATGYRLGTTFTIRITANSSGVYVAYNGVNKASFAGRVARNASPDKVSGDGWFFKAGLYLQTNTAKGEAPNEFGEGVISRLVVSHSNAVCG